MMARSRKRLREVVRVAKLVGLLELIRWGEPWDVEEDYRTGDKVPTQRRSVS